MRVQIQACDRNKGLVLLGGFQYPERSLAAGSRGWQNFPVEGCPESKCLRLGGLGGVCPGHSAAIVERKQ